ncbi:MAG: anti-sigma factor domain-containing protein [Acidimicrobiales bacterium]
MSDEMNDEMSHEELMDLLGAYAIDAVDSHEAEAVERHLEGCPRCRAEVTAHKETASWLGNAGGAAPEGLWDRIAASLEETPPRIELARVVESPRRTKKTVLGMSRPWTFGVIGSVATAAAVIIALLAVQIGSLNDRVNQLTPSVQDHGMSQVVAAAVADPNAQRASLRSATGQEAADAVVLPNGRGFLVGSRLRPLPSSETYQLWAVTGKRQISLGLLGNQPGEAAFSVASGTEVSLLAITAEQAGGVVSSNRPAVVWGTLQPRSA